MSEPVSGEYGEVTIQPVYDAKYVPKDINKTTIANQIPFTTVKYGG